MNINVGDMVRVSMQKRGFTFERLASELTKQQEILGHKGIIRKQNLHAKVVIRDGEAGITPEMARRIEIILDLPRYSLVDLCPKRALNSKAEQLKLEKVNKLLGGED